MKTEPDKLIEQNGYIYKLMPSKEERLKLDKEAKEKLERNFNAFKSKLGTDLYNYLSEHKAVVKYVSGGNYYSTAYYDFANNTTWTEYEYSDEKRKHFGETDWYNYDGSLRSNFLDSPIYKAISDYLLNEIQTKK